MGVKDSEIYRHILESEIRRHASHRFDLLIEEDLARWAAERKGDLKGNPPASSVIDSQTGAWGILVRRTIDGDWIASIIDRIEYGGFIRAREVLDSPEIFLSHLVLHELAHLENNWGQDQEYNNAMHGHLKSLGLKQFNESRLTKQIGDIVNLSNL